MTTFYDHLVSQARQRDPVGQLAKLAQADSEGFPRTPRLPLLRSYLQKAGHRDIIDAADAALCGWRLEMALNGGGGDA